jgi:ABC-type anion transport system duplicated permease subunit
MTITDVKSLNDLMNVLLNSTPEMLLLVGLICLGYVFKVINAIPNKYIPRLNLIIALIVYPLIAIPGNQPPSIKYPLVAVEIKAVAIFAIAWIIHAVVLKRFIDKYMPVNESGDTKILVKSPEVKEDPKP